MTAAQQPKQLAAIGLLTSSPFSTVSLQQPFLAVPRFHLSRILTHDLSLPTTETTSLIQNLEILAKFTQV